MHGLLTSPCRFSVFPSRCGKRWCPWGCLNGASFQALHRTVGPGRAFRREREPLGCASPEHPPPFRRGECQFSIAPVCWSTPSMSMLRHASTIRSFSNLSMVIPASVTCLPLWVMLLVQRVATLSPSAI
jgi:hypothetical protein